MLVLQKQDLGRLQIEEKELSVVFLSTKVDFTIEIWRKLESFSLRFQKTLRQVIVGSVSYISTEEKEEMIILTLSQTQQLVNFNLKQNTSTFYLAEEKEVTT